jgi:hypothetical protein
MATVSAGDGAGPLGPKAERRFPSAPPEAHIPGGSIGAKEARPGGLDGVAEGPDGSNDLLGTSSALPEALVPRNVVGDPGVAEVTGGVAEQGGVAEKEDWKPYLSVVPPGWPRGVLVGTTVLLTVLIALADLASAWVLAVLPIMVALAVAYHEAIYRIMNR